MSSAQAKRPARVGVAVVLLFLATLLSLGRDWLAWRQLASGMTGDVTVINVFVVGAAAIYIGIYTLILFVLFWRIGRGSNWARLVYLVAFLASALGFAAFFGESSSTMPVVWSLSLGQIALQGLAVILLFGGAAGRWFQPASTPPRSRPETSAR